MLESTDRLAWTSTRNEGRGSGMLAFRDRQPQTQGEGKKAHPYTKDYYVKSKGKA